MFRCATLALLSVHIVFPKRTRAAVSQGAHQWSFTATPHRQADVCSKCRHPLDSHLDECEPWPRVALPADTLLDIGRSPQHSLAARIVSLRAVWGDLGDFAPGVHKGDQVLAIGAACDNTAQRAATKHEVSDGDSLSIEFHVV